MLPLLLSALERPEEKRIFTLFFQTHEQGLLRYARSLTGSPVLGEEVCQEAWMKCLQHAETFFAIPPDRRLGWMVVIVKHTAYSLLEKEGRHLPLDPDWDAPAPEAGDVQGIVDLIRALPEQYRTILELKFLWEWTDRAIAQAVGLSVDAVSARVSLGRTPAHPSGPFGRRGSGLPPGPSRGACRRSPLPGLPPVAAQAAAEPPRAPPAAGQAPLGPGPAGRGLRGAGPVFDLRGGDDGQPGGPGGGEPVVFPGGGHLHRLPIPWEHLPGSHAPLGSYELAGGLYPTQPGGLRYLGGDGLC